MRELSAEKTGLNFWDASCVSSTGWPSGRNFTQTWPGPKNELLPRMKASLRPSGESAGYTAEAVKKVGCSQSLLAGGLFRSVRYRKNAPAASASTRIAAAA